LLIVSANIVNSHHFFVLLPMILISFVKYGLYQLTIQKLFDYEKFD